jgi:hypothetical protein
MTNFAAVNPADYAASVYAPSVMLDYDQLPIGDVVRDAQGVIWPAPRERVEVEVIERDDDTVHVIAYRGAGAGARRFRMTRMAIEHEGRPFVSWALGVKVPGLGEVWAAVAVVATPADGANAIAAFLDAGPGVGNSAEAAMYAGGIKAAWARFAAAG